MPQAKRASVALNGVALVRQDSKDIRREDAYWEGI
jgi:hypothetical protein